MSDNDINDKEGMKAAAGSRDQLIIKTSIIGILANVFLASFKAAVGVLSNSIEIGRASCRESV